MRVEATQQVLGLLLLSIVQVISTNQSSTLQACRLTRSKTSTDLDVHCLLETLGDLTTEFVPQHLRKRIISINLHSHNDTFELTYQHLRNMSALRTLIIYGRQPIKRSANFIGLSAIQPFTFRDCKQLRQLSLSSNHLQSLEREVFSGLSNLQILDLMNNPIERLDPLVFAPLRQRLQVLSYAQPLRDAIGQRNGLYTGFFVNFTALEVLSVATRGDDNDVPHFTVQMGAINIMPKLRVLSLISNYALTIRSGAFIDLPALEEIHLLVNGELKLKPDILRSSSVQKRANGIRSLRIASQLPVQGLTLNKALFQCELCGEQPEKYPQRFTLRGMGDRIYFIKPEGLKLEDNFPANDILNITWLSVTVALQQQVSRKLLQRMPRLTYLQITGEAQAFNFYAEDFDENITRYAELTRQKGLPLDFRLYGLRSLLSNPVSPTNKLLKQVNLAAINCTCQAVRKLEDWVTAESWSRSVSLRCHNFQSTEIYDGQSHYLRDELMNVTYFADFCRESKGPNKNVPLISNSVVKLVVPFCFSHIYWLLTSAWLINRVA